MQRILEGLSGVECHMDDIIVHGANQAEHDNRLEAVQTRLQDANAMLNCDKCEFSRILENCSIFGSTGWKRKNPRWPHQVAALRHMAEPADIHQL